MIEVLTEKATQEKEKGEELEGKFHSLDKVVQGEKTTWVAQYEPHVSVGGLLVQAYFGRMTYFWRKIYFGKRRSIFGVHAIGGKISACKINMKEEKKCGAHEDIPNHARVMFFDKIVMTISQ